MGGQRSVLVGVVCPSRQYKQRCQLSLEGKVTKRQQVRVGETVRHGSALCVGLLQVRQPSMSTHEHTEQTMFVECRWGN